MQRKKDNIQAVARRCPVCGKPASVAERPFCSRRCAEIDLHRWLSDGYRVPGEPAAPEEVGAAPRKPEEK
ncbi:MAG: DNA gyrase inhibitor YacG [Methylovirgula sp.]